MNITRENAVEKYCEIIENSWTWDCLTHAEKMRWLDLVARLDIKGTAQQRFSQIRDIYNIYLISCDYTSGYKWYDPTENNT